MKILGLIAAALLGTVSVAPASASAAVAAPAASLATAAVATQQVVVRERTVVRRNDRGYRNGRNRWGTRQVCTSRWRGGRKIRTCRSVRYRR